MLPAKPCAGPRYGTYFRRDLASILTVGSVFQFIEQSLLYARKASAGSPFISSMCTQASINRRPHQLAHGNVVLASALIDEIGDSGAGREAHDAGTPCPYRRTAMSHERVIFYRGNSALLVPTAAASGRKSKSAWWRRRVSNIQAPDHSAAPECWCRRPGVFRPWDGRQNFAAKLCQRLRNNLLDC